jgi:hypothetical protein
MSGGHKLVKFFLFLGNQNEEFVFVGICDGRRTI